MTMTKLPTHVAFDLLVVEQLHDIVPCSWEDDPCSRTAHWVLMCTQCGDMDFLCSPHRVHLDEAEADDDEVYCTACEHVHSMPLPWQAV